MELYLLDSNRKKNEGSASQPRRPSRAGQPLLVDQCASFRYSFNLQCFLLIFLGTGGELPQVKSSAPTTPNMPGAGEKEWQELSSSEQKAATLLGYDEALWNGNGKIAIENKDWEELSDDQKKAAEAIGFDEDEWDDSDDEDKARYEDVEWKHLLPGVKAAAIELGYTEEMWDAEGSGKKLDIEDKDWDELTETQRNLLKVLGYNEDVVSAVDSIRSS